MKTSPAGVLVVVLHFSGLFSPALAQATGAIQGVVVDAISAAPVPGALVTARSPSLQGEQTAVSDHSGYFQISILPVGDYALAVQREGYQPFAQDASVGVHLGQTVAVRLALVSEAPSAGSAVVVATRPVIDTRSTQSGGVVGSEQMLLIPYGRTARNFEAVATSIPGVSQDPFGLSMRGSGSPEGHYIIDGINVTDPSMGTQGTTLLQDFVEQVEVKTGGYQAEYGRSSGGVINVVTKSGGNETHGSVFLNWSPLELARKRLASPNTPIAIEESQRYSLDFGAEVGGAILKDRLWFFAGFAPQFKSLYEDRIIQALQDNGSGLPVVAPDGTLAYQEVARKRYTQTNTSLQYAGKITWLLNESHSIALAAYGNPTTGSGPFGAMNGNEGTFLTGQHTGSTDFSLRYAAKLFEKTMLIEGTLGYYRQLGNPNFAGAQAVGIGAVGADKLRDTPLVISSRPRNLLDPAFQDATMPGYQRNLSACQVHANGFDPCPVIGYATGGPGLLLDLKLQRVSAGAKLTNFFELGGHHQLKYGVEVAVETFTQFLALSGDELAVELPGPGFFSVAHFGYQDPSGTGLPANDPARPGHVLGEQTQSFVRNKAASFFVQDTWSILDRVVLDAGVRGEKQLMYGDPTAVDAAGNRLQGAQIDLFNLMPRLGLLYDFTGRGLSKVYGSVGRFYEFVPLDLANRSFNSASSLFTFLVNAGNCPGPPGTVLARDPRYCAVLPGPPGRTYQFLSSKASVPIDPNLQGQYVDEAQAGMQLQVYRDVVVGVEYVHRQLGRAIEDMSVDDGATYFLSNPGEPGKRGYQPVTETGVRVDEPRPRRIYDGITLSVRKLFSRNYLFSASYTYSSLRGNYPGLFRAETGQLGPNILTDYDVVSLLPNRYGPLPGDVPNSFKVDAGYVLQVSPRTSVQVGGNLRADQGQPVNYLGAYRTFGANETYILPRGSAGRLPWLWEIDARVAATRKLGSRYAATLSLDVFNLTNNRAVTAVDQRYTSDSVLPLVNGQPRDLPALKTIDGRPATVNAAFRNPTSYQLPLSARIGGRISF